MATVPIGKIIGTDNLLGVSKRLVSGVPNPFPPALFAVTKRVHKDYGKMRWFDGSQAGLKRTNYGSPAVQRGLLGLNERYLKLYHSFEVQMHDADVLIALQNYDSPVEQQMGRDEIARQASEFVRMGQTTRIGMVASALVNGKLYFSTTGELQTVSSTTTAVVVDYSIPATHLNQVDSSIGTTWNNAAVDIETDIKKIKQKALEDCGQPLKYAFYGQNIPGYLARNNTIKNLMNASGRKADAALEGQEIVNPLLGLTWIDASQAFALSGTTAYQWWGGDEIVFTPDINPTWWNFIEGSTPVPKTIGVAGQSPEEAVGNIMEAFGMFQYCAIEHNPVRLEHYAGDTCIPDITNPKAIIIADVTP